MAQAKLATVLACVLDAEDHLAAQAKSHTLPMFEHMHALQFSLCVCLCVCACVCVCVLVCLCVCVCVCVWFCVFFG